MLEIVLIPEILEPPESGALGLSLFSLMVNLRLHRSRIVYSRGHQRGARGH